MYISSWICPESSSADWSLRRYSGPHIICGSSSAVRERLCVWPKSRGVSVASANYSAQRRRCDSYPYSCLWRGTKLFEQSLSAYLHVIYVHTEEAMHLNADYFTRRIETRLFDRKDVFDFQKNWSLSGNICAWKSWNISNVCFVQKKLLAEQPCGRTYKSTFLLGLRFSLR